MIGAPRRRVSRWLLVVLAAAIVAAGCGGSQRSGEQLRPAVQGRAPAPQTSGEEQFLPGDARVPDAAAVTVTTRAVPIGRPSRPVSSLPRVPVTRPPAPIPTATTTATTMSTTTTATTMATTTSTSTSPVVADAASPPDQDSPATTSTTTVTGGLDRREIGP